MFSFNYEQVVLYNRPPLCLYYVPGSALKSRQNKTSQSGPSTFQGHSDHTHQVNLLGSGLHVVLPDFASLSAQIAVCDVTAPIMGMVHSFPKGTYNTCTEFQCYSVFSHFSINMKRQIVKNTCPEDAKSQAYCHQP